MNAVRIPRKNETTQQRLRRLLRERKGTPYHEDYEDGNPSKEMRVRSETVIKEPAPTYRQMVEMGEQAVAHIKEKFGKDWSYTIHQEENGDYQLKLTENE